MTDGKLSSFTAGLDWVINLPQNQFIGSIKVDPATKEASRVLSISGAPGLMGIAEISPDVFAVVAGDLDTKTFAPRSGSYAVYEVDLTRTTPVKKVPESGFFIGSTK
ncbi:hypothetical protein QBC33DRAFT_622700 [Phialemonium atrogriseum]|uniref:Uncharacterized protein n=1 Tax=Phialemonium atrogriseum TaxID=1093897 RepID=A0AAJ0BSL8_9PEZI|nr:uncharacterized protein QBC33DRAFT_622700 [Phialemonium atrogriseum]KAK1763734.1 hypothetical protein QBC33DRAFT_622700 [Phialemonium atrogriseum]